MDRVGELGWMDTQYIRRGRGIHQSLFVFAGYL